jgi:hypothetical protein
VRNLERAGVSCSDAMAMVGHQTESMCRCYAISDETSLREAAAKLEAPTPSSVALVRRSSRCVGSGNSRRELHIYFTEWGLALLSGSVG